jgi:hypothetical protein
MRVLWTLLKIALALAFVIPISIILLVMALGLLGALFGIAIVALKFAVIALIGVGLFKLFARLFGGPSHRRQIVTPLPLPAADPHYEAAMRELDRELGG